MSFVKLKGHRILLENSFIQKDQTAKDFCLIGSDLKEHHLSDFGLKKKLIYTVPSLDTEVCLKSTKLLNDAAKKYTNTAFIVVSCDLPFAHKRICSIESMEKILTLSMMRDKSFAKEYGVLIKEGVLEGLCARALIVLNENNKVIYTELVEEITHEPDYHNAFRYLD